MDEDFFLEMKASAGLLCAKCFLDSTQFVIYSYYWNDMSSDIVTNYKYET